MVNEGLASMTWMRPAFLLWAARISLALAELIGASGGSGRASSPTPAVRHPDAARTDRSRKGTRRNTCMADGPPGRSRESVSPARIAESRWERAGKGEELRRRCEGYPK